MNAKFRRACVLAALGAVTASAVAAGGVSAKSSGDGPGNSPDAKACQKGGWKTLVREDGTPFVNRGDCVSYAAQGGVLEPKPTGPVEPTPLERCKQQLADAGLTEPDNANIILGTEDDDDFTSQMTEGNDAVCGFAGNDRITDPVWPGGTPSSVLRAGDIFLGGDGADFVGIINGGTFNGGAGNDDVNHMVRATINGGPGDDSLGLMEDGTFDGGDGNDTAEAYCAGVTNEVEDVQPGLAALCR